MRDAWDETLGDMSEEIFLRALHDMQSFQPSPSVFFGGFGEPLAHPGIVEMVSRAKTAGAPRVELVTNGCFLGEEMSIRLINAGLDRLWVSLDGLQPEAFSDTRLGASLPTVLANVRDFVRARMRLRWTPHATSDLRAVQFDPSLGDVSAAGEQLLPELGIVFVATRRNIAELPRAIDEGRRLGARRFLVTNVLPYTEEVAAEILYENVLEVTPLPTHWDDEVRLPPPPHGCDGPHP
jgi:MoaA/NifB/PqqE/SkfB family radical SAM enzyme